MKRITFISPLAYPILAGLKNVQSAGGSQTQSVLIAKELSLLGWQVSLLVADYGQSEDQIEIDGINVYKVFKIFNRKNETHTVIK